jgi:hypothetical protein
MLAKIYRVSQSGHPQRKQHLVIMLSQQRRAVLGHRVKQNAPCDWMEDM